MPEKHSVAGVRFRNAGKIFYFHSAGMRIEAGEYVVVETVRGPEVGKVVIGTDQVVVNELGNDLKPILRLATDADVRKADELRSRAEALLPEARKLAQDARFPARIDTAEFTLDGRRLTFSFESDDRLDYRDFLRTVGNRFGARVDMRQVGARDRARAAGGYGICGRELCCSNWLTTFPAISIRMAKEQDLPLNPQKISGLCGRLLCCLSYEEEGYKEMRKTLPKLGQRCSTPTGEGKVIGINILQRRVTLVVEGQRIEVGDRDLGLVVRWDATSRAGAPPPPLTEEELRALGRFEEPADGSGGDSGPSNWGSPPASRDSGRGRLPAPRPAPRPASERPAAREAPPQRRSQARPPKRQESPSGADTQTPRRSEPRDAGPPSPPTSPSRAFRRAGPPPTSSKEPGIGGANPADGTAAEPSQAGGAPRSRRRGRRHGPRDTGGPPTDLNQSREPNNH